MNYLMLAAAIFTAAIALMYLAKVIAAVTGRVHFESNLIALTCFLILAVTGTAAVWFFQQAIA